MNVLLLLSALLSALTGMSAPARGPQPAAAISAVAARAVTPAAHARTSRPVAALPALRALAGSAPAHWYLPALEPLFAGRRRH